MESKGEREREANKRHNTKQQQKSQTNNESKLFRENIMLNIGKCLSCGGFEDDVMS